MSHYGPLALISLDHLIYNYRALQKMAPRTLMGAVVKANAYGLGVHLIAPPLAAAGCQQFFVAQIDEGIALRALLPNARIAVLHGFPVSTFDEAAQHALTPVLNDWRSLSNWSSFAQMKGRAMPAFIHLDTGMSRLGLSPLEQSRLQVQQDILKPIKIEGWVSHFARAEEFDCEATRHQRDRLLAQVATLPPAPICLCNSSGLFWGADYHFDIARPGLALYGGNPTPDQPNPMRPVVTWKAPIIQIRDVEAGDTVGYGSTVIMKKKGRLASLCFGYADGFPRSLSNQGLVAIDRFFAPLVGRVSMDQLLVDVTDIPDLALYNGQMGTILGDHRPLDRMAQEAGLIPYELLTGLGLRVQRRVQEKGFA